MDWFRSGFAAWWAMLAMSSTVAGHAQRNKELRPSLKINVFVHNYAGVSKKTMTRAKQIAAQIYRHAGIGMVWHDVDVNPADPADGPSIGPTGLTLRILPLSMSPALPINSHTFGVAYPFTAGSFGVASIVFERVKKLASRKRISRGLLLSHVMAHEMGHLLLGRDSHSGKGIMQIPWGGEALRRAARGNLLFREREAALMRRKVAARLHAASDFNRSRP